jgi:branched-subunit amino acid aminotransferase/4-amino-4-deoxychorismate lyase
VPPHRQPPDPGRGVFETLLVVDGEPIELAAHLRRLANSVELLYHAALPEDAGQRAVAAAKPHDLGRLRLTYLPGGDLQVEASPVGPDVVFPAPDLGARLQALDLPGGLGSHKWVDRPGLDRADDGAGQLLCDGGELLEAGWANLFAVSEGALRTPAADGRILPGVARARALALAPDLGLETREQPLTAAELLAADEVFLTNSIRGVESALSIEGAELPGAGPVSRRLAAALAQSWRLPAPRGVPPTPAAAPIPGPPAR